MGIFAFPRINVKGLINIGVGTANNDDYSSTAYYKGKPLRLADSITVQPVTYGMDDATFIDWVVNLQAFDPPPSPDSAKVAITRANANVSDAGPVYEIPAEWNYYGDMGMTMVDVNVVAVEDPDHLIGQNLVGAQRGGMSRWV